MWMKKGNDGSYAMIAEASIGLSKKWKGGSRNTMGTVVRRSKKNEDSKLAY